MLFSNSFLGFQDYYFFIWTLTYLTILRGILFQERHPTQEKKNEFDTVSLNTLAANTLVQSMKYSKANNFKDI